MRLKLLLPFILFLGFARAQAQPSQPGPQSAERARIERLAGLAKVWGAVKFFHPYLAYKEIDWDKALVETIPKVNAAKTPQEYQAAINSMLAVLDDRNTRAEIEGESKPKAGANTSTGANKADPVRLEEGVLVIEAMAIAETLASDQSAAQQIYPKISALMPQAKAVVLDCRPKRELNGAEADYANFFFDNFLRGTVAQLSDKPVRLGSSRYRLHNGYAPQSGATSGGYYSALVETAPEAIAGTGKSVLPLAIIVNDKTPGESEIFEGLQAGGKAAVVREGEAAAEIGVGSYKIKLPDGVKVRMRTTENVNPDGSIGFRPDASVPRSADDAALKEAMRIARENRFARPQGQTASAALQRDAKDDPYPQMQFPSAEYRLLALFRFWSVINYFYPYKNLIGESWETVLPRYIPKFEADKDELDYQTTVREMVTEIHDSHGFVRGTTEVDKKLGAFTPPVLLRYVEKQVVVGKVFDDKVDLRAGDVLLAIDGEPVERRREASAKLFAASTPQALYRISTGVLLLGEKDSRVKLTVRDLEGRTKEVEVVRSQSLSDPKYRAAFARSTPVFGVLPSGFGYVDLARLQLGEVDQMFETIKNTPATIFDMRGYPNGTAWAIAPRLTEKKSVVGALFSRPIWEATNLDDADYTDGTNYTFAQTLPESKGDVYRGKVVMLINEDAISQAEHTCLFFEAARPDITFVGSPTAGANGDVTNLVLPGNITVNFTGQSVQHADGRQLQRVGIQPAIRVEPTIRGLSEGRDEVLEAAIKFLQPGKAKP
jgi:C-terminal processing protease CtpA/Prc